MWARDTGLDREILYASEVAVFPSNAKLVLGIYGLAQKLQFSGGHRE